MFNHTAITVFNDEARYDRCYYISPLLLELSMTHLFKQMYSDNILLLKEEFKPSELTTAITVQLIEREIQRIGFKTLSGESCS